LNHYVSTRSGRKSVKIRRGRAAVISLRLGAENVVGLAGHGFGYEAGRLPTTGESQKTLLIVLIIGIPAGILLLRGSKRSE
jgi:hypothetical protein